MANDYRRHQERHRRNTCGHRLHDMRDERFEAPVARIPAGLGVGLAISAIATIYLGVLPGRVLEYAIRGAQDLMK